MKKALFMLVLAVFAVFTLGLPKSVTAFNLNLFASSQSTKITFIQVTGRLDQQLHQAIIDFTKLKDARHIWYEFTYDYNGVTQGAKADFAVNGAQKITKTIFLGTCSTGGGCIYHYPTQAHLWVVVQYKDGRNFASNYTIY